MAKDVFMARFMAFPCRPRQVRRVGQPFRSVTAKQHQRQIADTRRFYEMLQ
jgi:hypothetical protein